MNTILAFLFALEMGFVPSNTMIDWVNKDGIHGYTTLEAGFIVCDILYIKGIAKTFIELSDETGYSFYPHQIDYSFDFGIHLDWFSFGLRHTCFHPAFIGERDYRGHLDRQEEIYFRIESKINLF